jgi:hypothetical protein
MDNGKVAVKDHHVVLRRGGLLERLGTVPSNVYRHPFSAEPKGNLASERSVILNHEYPHGCLSMVPVS